MSDGERTFLLRKARVAAECDMCGHRIAAGHSFALLSGARSRATGKALGDMKFCGMCSALYMPKPDKWDEHFNPPKAPTVSECLELVDSGLCDAGCILAREDQEGCECRCGGDYHGELRLAIAIESVDRTIQRARSSDADLAELAALDPTPKTIREARKRLGWNNARTLATMRMYRDATNIDGSHAWATSKEEK